MPRRQSQEMGTTQLLFLGRRAGEQVQVEVNADVGQACKTSSECQSRRFGQCVQLVLSFFEV